MSRKKEPKNNSIAVDIVVKFRISSVCSSEDLKSVGRTIEEEVKWLIKNEGLFSIVDDLHGDIIEIKEVKDA